MNFEEKDKEREDDHMTSAVLNAYDRMLDKLLAENQDLRKAQGVLRHEFDNAIAELAQVTSEVVALTDALNESSATLEQVIGSRNHWRKLAEKAWAESMVKELEND